MASRVRARQPRQPQAWGSCEHRRAAPRCEWRPRWGQRSGDSRKRGGPVAMLSDDAIRRIDREVAKYPADQKRSAVMSALAIAQDEHGWLPAEALDDVARHLGMPTIAVYEVASFYAMYDLKPTGHYKLTICTNLPCALQGAAAAAEHLKHKLGIGFGETTGDGKFTLKEGECFGACGDAPVLLVNNKRMASFMNPPALDALLDELSATADTAASVPRASGPE
jgi:NADH-quinone oxidoreductase subunit E